ncbi:hypothetical protein, partial [Foetidibacter luteolus]
SLSVVVFFASMKAAIIYDTGCGLSWGLRCVAITSSFCSLGDFSAPVEYHHRNILSTSNPSTDQ